MPTAQTSVGPDAQIPNSVGALLGSTGSAHNPCTKRGAIPRDPEAPATQTEPSSQRPHAVQGGRRRREGRGRRDPLSGVVARVAAARVEPGVPGRVHAGIGAAGIGAARHVRLRLRDLRLRDAAAAFDADVRRGRARRRVHAVLREEQGELARLAWCERHRRGLADDRGRSHLPVAVTSMLNAGSPLGTIPSVGSDERLVSGNVSVEPPPCWGMTSIWMLVSADGIERSVSTWATSSVPLFLGLHAAAATSASAPSRRSRFNFPRSDKDRCRGSRRPRRASPARPRARRSRSPRRRRSRTTSAYRKERRSTHHSPWSS